MNHVPCRERKFQLAMFHLYTRTYWSYLHFLKQMLERLGHGATTSVWKHAIKYYDDSLLKHALKEGWSPVDESSLNIETKISEYLNKLFLASVEGVTQDEARKYIEQMPPFPQIRQRRMTLTEAKEITTYEALAFSDGRPMLSQSLLELYGKQGELIAYDIIRANRTKVVKQAQTSFKDFVADYCTNLKSTCPTIFTAGLDVDIVRRSDTEFVAQVKECEWSRYYRERFPKVAYLVACSTDDAHAQACVPGIQMQRTKTLMEGGDFCDFRYYVPETSAG